MRRHTALLILVFALSGASALVDQVVWARLLAYLLGGTTVAIGTVLASFMGGLAAGSYLMGRVADRLAAPLRAYAWLEIAVGASAAAVPVLAGLVEPLHVAAARALPPWLLGAARTLLALLLLLPPTLAMGGTLPVLGRALARSHERLGRDLGLLYAANTLGAMLGAVAAAFFLVPNLGLGGGTAAAVGGNLVAAGVAWALHRRAAHAPAGRRARESPRVPKPAAGSPPELHPGPLALVFALSGFAALGFEVYWTRALQSFLGNTTYAFGTMLATYLFGLGLGGWAGGRLADRLRSPARCLGWVLLGIGVAAAATVPVLWNLLPRLETARFFSAPEASWGGYLLRRFAAAFAVMAVPTVLAGMVFPLVNRAGIASLAHLGSSLGKLVAANTLGAIAGSLAATFLMLPWLGVRDALLATAIVPAAAGVAVQAWNRQRRRAGIVAAAALLGGVMVASPVLSRHARPLRSDTQGSRDAVLFEREDATAATRVYRKPNGELHLSVDGRHVGGTEPGTLRKQKLLAHLPCALAPRPERALAVGLGSGITLGTLAFYDEVRRLVCVEIVPGVAAAAALFREHHGDVLHDPRLRLVTGDAVQYLLTTRERFDLISSDSKLNPEYAGNTSILSREYYELCRERLTQNGVMVQWLPAHIPNSVVRIVTRTFVEVFPHVELFWIDPGEILMAGGRSPLRLDFDVWARRSTAPAVHADLAGLGLDDPYVLANTRVAGREHLAPSLAAVPLHTWMRPTYEFRVVRDFRRKGQGYHEVDNLRWLAGLWADDAAYVGGADTERLARCRDSSRALLLGYASGGGVERLAGGRLHFEAGLARNPADARLARVLQRLDDEARAVTTRSPGTAGEWLRQGLALLDLGRPEAALQCFDRAVGLEPLAREARYNRLLALARLGRAEAAAGIVAFTRDFPGDARGWSQLAQRQAESGDLEAALASVRRAIAIDPSTASFWNNLAVTLVRLGRHEEAGAAFVRAHDLDPGFPEAAYHAAVSYSLAGRTLEAASWVAVCLERRLCDPTRFLTEAHFANLRASPQWRQERVERAAAAWNGGAP